MKKQNTELTKQMLSTWGIYSLEWDSEKNEWVVDRYWYKNKSNTKRHINLKINKAICKHKYTQNKEYPVITFSISSKTVCLPLARVVYAWFKGSIPEGMVVDHIDNNPFNNRTENLQLLTPEENLEKRFIDNPNANRNQWDAIKNMKKDCKEAYYTTQSVLVDKFNELYDKDQYACIKAMNKIVKYIEEKC